MTLGELERTMDEKAARLRELSAILALMQHRHEPAEHVDAMTKELIELNIKLGELIVGLRGTLATARSLAFEAATVSEAMQRVFYSSN